MRRAHKLGGSLLAGGWLALVAVTGGCPGGGTIPLPPSVTAASVSTSGGSLTQNQSQAVIVNATVLGFGGTVSIVTADLTQIGGPATQPLSRGAGNTWTVTTTVTPIVAGLRQVIITAVDSNNLAGQGAATIAVSGSGGVNIPPVLTNPTINSALVAGFFNQVVTSVKATDVDGTVQVVVVDLEPIGGLPAEQMTQSTPDTTLWTFTGPVVPPLTGVMTIVFQATDNLGATGTISTTVPVNSAAP